MKSDSKLAKLKKSGFWKKQWFIILSLIFLAPLGAVLLVVYKLQPSKELTYYHKLIAYILLIGYVIVWASFVNGEYYNPDKPNTGPSQEQRHQPSEIDTARSNIGKDALINGGIPDVDANAIADRAIELDLRTLTLGGLLANDNPEINSYVIENADGTFNVSVINGSVVSIFDSNNHVVYENGQLNPEYVFASDIDWIGLKSRTETVIKSALKSPSSAQFPGGFLTPMDGWEQARDGSIVSLKSYVDSQNSFGAMIRSEFIVKFRITKDTTKAVYVNLDGQVLLDEQ